MARGWESKSVEAQQADASTASRIGPPISRDDAARNAEIATLTLARTRAAAELQKATIAAHRSMLEKAIVDLDRQIAELRR